MTHTVKLFGPARDAAGASEVEIEGAGDVGALLAALAERYPALGRMVEVSAVAVNCEYARPEQPLKEGDEIALIPPVSGG